MNKLTTKNWQRVRINTTAKTITFTNDTTYKTEAECLADIKSNQYIAINKRRFDKMIGEGWIEMITVSKETAQICDDAMILVDTKEEWQPQYLVGGEIEKEIQAYVSSKKSKQAVLFVKNVQGLKDRTKVSALEVFGETKFEKVQPLTFHSAYDRFEKTQIGRERKAQMMEVGV